MMRAVWMVMMTPAALGEAAGLEKARIGRVAIINVMIIAAVAGDRQSVGIDGDIGNAVLL